MKIGFIGLGIMGSRMAANLQKHEHLLAVHNRTKVKAESLIANGALWLDTPAQAAEEVTLLFTMLSTPEAVRQVALDQDGFLNHLKPNSLWVDCSTVNPSFSRQMAAESLGRQVRFIDAPVVGSKDPAEKGQLLFLAGGDPVDVQACQPCWTAMGRQVIHLGAHGAGSAMKMLFAMLLGQSMLAFSEAMLLGESLGIPRETLFQVLFGAPVTAPFLAGKRTKIETGQYDADFPLRWLHKDLQLASMTGYEQRTALPATNLAKEIYALAARAGLGEKDFSAILQFLEQKGERT